MLFLGLGSNLGDRLQNLELSVALIENSFEVKLYRSSIYETSAILPENCLSKHPDYLNMVVAFECSLDPFVVLKITQGIEVAMGRTSKGDYSPRIIDIDILQFNDLIINHPDLSIPHVLMHERDFVLVPLKEIEERLTFV